MKSKQLLTNWGAGRTLAMAISDLNVLQVKLQNQCRSFSMRICPAESFHMI